MHGVRSAILSGEGVRPATPVAAKKKKSDVSSRGSLTAISVKREESRLTNQRREERHRDIFEEATIHFRRRKYHVPVVNASASGVMVESDIEPRIGEALQIQFNDCNKTQCVVRWIRGTRIGLEFNRETTIIGPSRIQDHIIGKLRGSEEGTLSDDEVAKASRTPRHNFIWFATVHSEHRTMPVRLRNISPEGAMLEAEHEFAVGAEILLDLEEAGTAFAKVRWARGGQLGIKFNNKFNLHGLTRCKVSATAESAKSGKTTTYMLKPQYLDSEMSPDSPWAAMWDRLTPGDLRSK